MSEQKTSPQQQQASEQTTTHFGYKEVPTEEKESQVADVFDSVASKYDLMNDLMSFGVHRLWKRFTIDKSGVRAGHRVLDIAGGTGDLTKKFSRIVGRSGQVVLADINARMLKVGRDRLLDGGFADNIEYIQANAEKLPFADNSFNCVTIAFGLRNVTHKEIALAEFTRVLKPGGKAMVLEFSKPTNILMSKAYDAYSFTALPALGRLVTNDSDSYQYLVESIRMHPDQVTLKGMMEAAGMSLCEYHNLTGGIVALHTGIKA
jgi:demethylmenaquinone methyltransferase / 2-methoxy-6-polyprenyl-1,4-benzoquinol methylase